MSSTDTVKIYETMCRTAKEAGEIIASTRADSVGKAMKSGTANYVTECDVRVQKFIFEKLSVFSPEVGFFGEEDCGSNGGECDLVFIVDPIDGTSNFMFDLKLSVVSIALGSKKDDSVLAAAIYCPFTGELFSAIKNGGAFVNGKPISVSQNDLEHSLAAFGSTPYDRAVSKLHMSILADVFAGCIDVRNLGSAALHLAYVAAGRFSAFYELRLSPWDYAAGSLLITEAGGKISNFGGKAVNLSALDSVMAGGPTAYEELSAIIRKHL
ncbi:MAG: inositol monophosphatase [Clostridia bacterium]|nr:inositol monophosphatase [Clostridia bacterium]